MKVQEMPLAAGEPSHLDNLHRINAHSLKRGSVSDRRDYECSECSVVLKANEPSIEEMINAWSQRPMNEDIPAELRALIATLNDELEVIGTAHPRSLEAEPAPERIYHYTDDAGFRGVLEYGNLWCTDPAYLNDPSEVKYGVSMAADMLAGYAMGAPAEVQIFAHDFRRYETHVENVAHFVVLSFSTNGNDLEQWHGYANKRPWLCDRIRWQNA
jgi:hypothetical protein